MVLGDVRQLVGKHTRQIFLFFKVHDQAGEHVHIAAGYGKSVERIVQDYSRLKVERLRRKGFDKAFHNLVDVEAHFRVFDNTHV